MIDITNKQRGNCGLGIATDKMDMHLIPINEVIIKYKTQNPCHIIEFLIY